MFHVRELNTMVKARTLEPSTLCQLDGFVGEALQYPFVHYELGNSPCQPVTHTRWKNNVASIATNGK